MIQTLISKESIHYLPRVRLDLRELELGVVRVHLLDLFSGRRAQDFDDLDELIDAGIAGEDRLTEHQFGKYASCAPDVDVGRVVRGAEDQLGRAVVSRTDVGHVGLAAHEMLGRSEIAELENAGLWVEEKVLGLDISVADALRVDVGKTAEELVHVQLDEGDGDSLLAFRILPGHLVDSLRDVLEDQVEVDLILLLAGRVKEVEQLDDVAVLQASHYLVKRKNEVQANIRPGLEKSANLPNVQTVEL